MKTVLKVAICWLLMCGVGSTASADEGEFVGYMTQMQYFTHKLALSIDAGNQDLQEFYAHEVEEQIEGALAVQKIGDIPVSKLMKELLVPRLETLEEAIKSGDAEAVNAGFNAMIEGCNRCHRASERQFIKVERRGDNPFMQSFSSQE